MLLRRSRLFAPITLLIAPMLACGGLGSTQGAEDAAEEFCAHLAADRMDEAYALTNSQFRADAPTSAAFAQMMRSASGVVGHTSRTLEAGTTQVGCGGTPSEIVVYGTLAHPEGTRRVELHMQPEGEHWKVGSVTMDAFQRTGGP